MLNWACARGCGTGGEKRYASATEAIRYAQAFDAEDRSQLGHRAPLFGLFPLRLVHWLRTHRGTKAPGAESVNG